MGLFSKKVNQVPIVINDIINNVPVRREKIYYGNVVNNEATGIKEIKIKGLATSFKLPKSDEWIMTTNGRGLEINVYNPDHYTYVKHTTIDNELTKIEVDQESIGLAIILNDVLKKYEDKKWWDTDVFRTSAILVIFLMIVAVSAMYMSNLSETYTDVYNQMDTKRHVEEMAWVNATTNIQELLKYNVNVMPSETAEAET